MANNIYYGVMKMKVFIWGTGAMASDYLSKQEITDEDLLGFIETRKTKDYFEGKKVFEPQEIAKLDSYDYILVCIKNVGREIYQLCKEMEIDVDKLILMDNWEWINGNLFHEVPSKCCKKIVNNNIDIQYLFPQFYSAYMKEDDIQADRYLIVSRNGYDLFEKDAPMLSEEFNNMIYQTDYFRYRSFELIANEIIKSKVCGNVAEVGVFRGTFARLINIKFRDKKLYLFDTFESFNIDEFHDELKAGRVPQEFMDSFKDTSVKFVLDNMIYPDMCIIKKGFFPESAIGLEKEEYAFVSIDVDFENSILEALRYFYPRLNVGGALFVHDYNNRFLEGVKKAVATYEQELGRNLSKVPLADEGGTIVIVK